MKPLLGGNASSTPSSIQRGPSIAMQEGIQGIKYRWKIWWVPLNVHWPNYLGGGVDHKKFCLYFCLKVISLTQADLIKDEASWQLGQTAADGATRERREHDERHGHDQQHHNRRDLNVSWEHICTGKNLNWGQFHECKLIINSFHVEHNLRSTFKARENNWSKFMPGEISLSTFYSWNWPLDPIL